MADVGSGALRALKKVALLWAGIVIGCTFIATPVKFMAPHLKFPVALEVGRLTFHAVGLAELILCAVFLGFLLFKEKRYWLGYVAPVCFIVDWLFVMPPLDARTVQEIAGAHGTNPVLHILSVLLEVVKLVALLWVGFSAVKVAPTGE